MMSSQPDQPQLTSKEEEDWLQAIQLATSTMLPFALKAAIDLDLLEIIAKAGPGSILSPTEIVSHLPANNPDAPSIIDRILRAFTAHSILACHLVTDEDGHTKRVYSIASIGKYFLQNKNGISVVPFLNMTLGRRLIECWNFFKEATLGGGLSFVRRFGMDLFELAAQDGNLASTFNHSMSNHTTIIMKKVLEIYKGFEGLSKLQMRVGDWEQILSSLFLSVEHVGGDMLTEVPHGEVIFVKCVFHDWGDEQCLKLLRNCYEAIPEGGKVILLESIAPEVAMTDLVTTATLNIDLGLLQLLPGAKERIMKEFETLTKEARFTSLKLVCRAYNNWVMELYPKIYILY
ncbi:hypothetical protein PTKIN_Ptkin01aG0375700 [Pterospermum kingtungense]